MARITTGDTEGAQELERILTHYAVSIIRLAFGYVKNLADAEDIVQDVFLTYWRKRPLFADEGKEWAWLMRVTANRCRDFHKSYGRTHTQPLYKTLPALPQKESGAMQALLELEDKYPISLWLFYFYGCSLKEIGRLMRVKPTTAGTWLDRGRRQLRERLGDDFDG